MKSREEIARAIWDALYPGVAFDGYYGGDKQPPQAFKAADAAIEIMNRERRDFMAVATSRR